MRKSSHLEFVAWEDNDGNGDGDEISHFNNQIVFFSLLGVWMFFIACLNSSTLIRSKWENECVTRAYVCACACAATVSSGILIKRNATLSVAYNFHSIYFFFFSFPSSSSFVSFSLLQTHVWCFFHLSIAFINDRLTDRIKRRKKS